MAGNHTQVPTRQLMRGLDYRNTLLRGASLTFVLIFGLHPIRKPATGLSCPQLGLVLAFFDAFRDATDGGLCRLCVVGA